MERRAKAAILSTYFLPYIAVPFVAASDLVPSAAEACWSEELAADFFTRLSVFLLVLGVLKLVPAVYFFTHYLLEIERAISSIISGPQGGREAREGGEREGLPPDTGPGILFSLAAICLADAEINASLAAQGMSAGDLAAFSKMLIAIAAIEVLIVAVAVLATWFIAKLTSRISAVFTFFAAYEALKFSYWLDYFAAQANPDSPTPLGFLRHFILSGFFATSVGDPSGLVASMLDSLGLYCFSMAAVGAYLLAYAALSADGTGREA